MTRLLYCAYNEVGAEGGRYYLPRALSQFLLALAESFEKIYLMLPIRRGVPKETNRFGETPKIEIVGSKVHLHRYIQNYIWSFGNVGKFKKLQELSDCVLVNIPSAITHVAYIPSITKPLITCIAGDEQETLKCREGALLRLFTKVVDARIRKVAEDFLIKRSDMIICMNSEFKRKLVEGYDFPASNISVIPPGVETNFFKPTSAEEKEKIKSRIGAGGKKVIGFAAVYLDRLKGTDVVLKVFDMIARKHSDVVLLLIGKDKIGIPHSRTEILHIDLVEQKNMPYFYNAMDIFLFPSRTEGMPRVLMEACSCGLPVVSTITGGIPELVKHGKNGFLAHTDDVDAITKYCEVLLEDERLRKEMGNEGRKHMMVNFGFEKCIAKFANVIKTLAKEENHDNRKNIERFEHEH